MAVASGRLLITEDPDFGELVFAGQQASDGVLYIRCPGNFRQRTQHPRTASRAATTASSGLG